ncbi:MAG: gamma-glutamyltransferase [Desulfocapsaceae bacterium]
MAAIHSYSRILLQTLTPGTVSWWKRVKIHPAMQEYLRSYRPMLMGNKWMVTTDHPLAAQAAASLLDKGGDAVDAAVLANLVMSVVNPHMCGLGGDLFALVYRADSRQVRALDAAGFAPRKASLDSYAGMGVKQIPASGIHTCTVPGALAGWQALLDEYGTFGLDTLIGRVLEYATDGFPVYEKLIRSIEKKRDQLANSPAAASIFLAGGRPPKIGELIKQPALAKSLALIAEQGPAAFYHGELGEDLVRYSSKLGGCFSLEDLADYRVIWKQPLTATYRGYKVATQPPPSQGMALLMQARILEQTDIGSMEPGSAELVHLMAEAKKLAFAKRDQYISDPNFQSIPLDDLLGSRLARRQAELIGARAAEQTCSYRFARGGEDTVYMMAVDDSGNAAVLIQSIFQEFGSCVMVPESGMLLHNRGRGFSMNPTHPCRLEPRKRPYHTLHPLMVMDADQPCLLLGSPGGDGQTQTNIQLLVNLIDFDADVQGAVDAPRWRSLPDGELLIENRFPEETMRNLSQKGHVVKKVEQFSSLMGSAQAIRIDREQHLLTGGADGRRLGYGLGR